MQLSIQAALLNVRNLDKSIEFYQDVLGLRTISQEDRVAALMIDETTGRQVLVLRELDGANPVHMGRGTIGPRVIILEAATPDELDTIEQRLPGATRSSGAGEPTPWEAIVGVDPDRIELSISASLTGGPIDRTHWGAPRPDGLRGGRVTSSGPATDAADLRGRAGGGESLAAVESWIDHAGDVIWEPSPSLVAQLVQAGQPFWLDIEDPSDEVINQLTTLVGLHSLAVESTRQFGQRAKLQVYGNGVTLVGFGLDEQLHEPVEVHCYYTTGFLITAYASGRVLHLTTCARKVLFIPSLGAIRSARCIR